MGHILREDEGVLEDGQAMILTVPTPDQMEEWRKKGAIEMAHARSQVYNEIKIWIRDGRLIASYGHDNKKERVVWEQEMERAMRLEREASKDLKAEGVKG